MRCATMLAWLFISSWPIAHQQPPVSSTAPEEALTAAAEWLRGVETGDLALAQMHSIFEVPIDRELVEASVFANRAQRRYQAAMRQIDTNAPAVEEATSIDAWKDRLRELDWDLQGERGTFVFRRPRDGAQQTVVVLKRTDAGWKVSPNATLISQDLEPGMLAGAMLLGHAVALEQERVSEAIERGLMTDPDVARVHALSGIHRMNEVRRKFPALATADEEGKKLKEAKAVEEHVRSSELSRPHIRHTVTLAGEVRCIRVSADGSLAAVGTAGAPESLALVNLQSGEKRQVSFAEGIEHPVFGLGLLPDGRLIVAGAGYRASDLANREIGGQMRYLGVEALGHDLRVVDVNTGQITTSLPSPQPAVATSISVAPDGAIVVAYDGGHAFLWTKGVAESPVRVADRALYERDDIHGKLTAVFADGNHVMLFYDGALILRVNSEGRILEEYRPDYPGAVAVSPNGKQLAVAAGSQVLVYDIGKTVAKTAIRVLDDPFNSLNCLAWLDDDRLAIGEGSKGKLIGEDPGIVRLFDVTSGKALREFHGHEFAVSALTFEPKNQLLISGDLSGRLIVWSLDEER